MSSSNLHIVTGRLGLEPNVRKFDNNRTNFRFSLATDRYAPNEPNNRSTSWIPVTYWASSEAEVAFLSQHLVKGALVQAIGASHSRHYQHEDYPVQMQAWDLHADRLEIFLPSRRESSVDSAAPEGVDAPSPSAQRAPRRNEPAPAPPKPAPARAPAPPPVMSSPAFAAGDTSAPFQF